MTRSHAPAKKNFALLSSVEPAKGSMLMAVPSMDAMTSTLAPSLIMFCNWLVCWSCLLSAYCRLTW